MAVFSGAQVMWDPIAKHELSNRRWFVRWAELKLVAVAVDTRSENEWGGAATRCGGERVRSRFRLAVSGDGAVSDSFFNSSRSARSGFTFKGQVQSAADRARSLTAA